MEPEPTVFRKFSKRDGGGVVALFPHLATNGGVHMCHSYTRAGGFGKADLNAVMEKTSPASRDEAAELRTEIEASPKGWAVSVVQEVPANAEADRRIFLKALGVHL